MSAFPMRRRVVRRNRPQVQQLEMLLSYMETHQLFARGQIMKLGRQGHVKYRNMWIKLTNQLNNFGTAQKNVEEWQNTWKQLRLAAKTKKARYLSSFNKTGNTEPCTDLTDFELRITAIYGSHGTGLSVIPELGLPSKPRRHYQDPTLREADEPNVVHPATNSRKLQADVKYKKQRNVVEVVANEVDFHPTDARGQYDIHLLSADSQEREARKRYSRSNNQQLTVLVQFMENNPQLARNELDAAEEGELWEILVTKLNKEGDQRGLKAWMKTWHDLIKTARQVSEMISNGERNQPLSDLHLRVLRLVDGRTRPAHQQMNNNRPDPGRELDQQQNNNRPQQQLPQLHNQVQQHHQHLRNQDQQQEFHNQIPEQEFDNQIPEQELNEFPEAQLDLAQQQPSTSRNCLSQQESKRIKRKFEPKDHNSGRSSIETVRYEPVQKKRLYNKSKYSQVGFASLLGLTNSPSKKSGTSSIAPKAGCSGKMPEVVDLTKDKSAAAKKAVISEMKYHNDNIQHLGAELTKSINDGFKSLVQILSRMLSAIYDQHAAQPKYEIKEEEPANGYKADEEYEDGNNEIKEEELEQIYGEGEERLILAGELLEDDAEEYDEEYLAEFLQSDFESEEFSKERFPDDD